MLSIFQLVVSLPLAFCCIIALSKCHQELIFTYFRIENENKLVELLLFSFNSDESAERSKLLDLIFLIQFRNLIQSMDGNI